MEESIIKEAIDSFKKEQGERQIKLVTDSFRSIVNNLHNINEEEKNIEKTLKKIGFEISDEFKEFLKSVDKYEDLVFSITLNGNIGIGTTAPNSKMFVYSSLGKELAVN